MFHNTDQTKPDQFPDSLLSDDSIAFPACWAEDRIIAGGKANRTSGVVGLSNAFIRAGDQVSVWANLVHQINSIFPGFPIVDYEKDEGLRTMVSIGFQAIIDLQV